MALPPHLRGGTFGGVCMLFWRFWGQCVEFCLFCYKAYPVSVIPLLSGLISGINEGV